MNRIECKTIASQIRQPFVSALGPSSSSSDSRVRQRQRRTTPRDARRGRAFWRFREPRPQNATTDPARCAIDALVHGVSASDGCLTPSRISVLFQQFPRRVNTLQNADEHWRFERSRCFRRVQPKASCRMILLPPCYLEKASQRVAPLFQNRTIGELRWVRALQST